MPQAKGTSAVVALFEEDTYGQSPAAPNGQLLYKTSFGVQKSQDRIEDDTLSDARSRAEPMLGNIDVGGSLEQNLSAHGIGTLLKHLMGVVATTGGSPYAHAFTVGDLPTGLTLEVDYGAPLSGSGRYIRYHGCKIGSAAFSFPTSGACTASFTLQGVDGVPAAAPLDATLTDNGHASFSAFSAAIEEGGASIGNVTSVDFTVDNGLDGDTYVIGGQGKRLCLEEGFVGISGSLTAVFNSTDLMNKALNNIESSLKITLSRGTGNGSVGNESIEFLMSQIKYEPTTPSIDGPAGISITLPFFAYAKAADLGLKITLKNNVSTV